MHVYTHYVYYIHTRHTSSKHCLFWLYIYHSDIRDLFLKMTFFESLLRKSIIQPYNE